MKIYKCKAESKFVKSYFNLIKKLMYKFKLEEIEAKEAVCVISEWLLENQNIKREDKELTEFEVKFKDVFNE